MKENDKKKEGGTSPFATCGSLDFLHCAFGDNDDDTVTMDWSSNGSTIDWNAPTRHQEVYAAANLSIEEDMPFDKPDVAPAVEVAMAKQEGHRV